MYTTVNKQLCNGTVMFVIHVITMGSQTGHEPTSCGQRNDLGYRGRKPTLRRDRAWSDANAEKGKTLNAAVMTFWAYKSKNAARSCGRIRNRK
jgi:hypothetical protein